MYNDNCFAQLLRLFTPKTTQCRMLNFSVSRYTVNTFVSISRPEPPSLTPKLPTRRINYSQSTVLYLSMRLRTFQNWQNVWQNVYTSISVFSSILLFCRTGEKTSFSPSLILSCVCHQAAIYVSLIGNSVECLSILGNLYTMECT